MGVMTLRPIRGHGLLPTVLAVLATLGALPAAPAQGRPTTAEAALAAFARVQTEPEGQRRRAARDLGAFADPAVTALLLRQLQEAKSVGYLQDLARSLGRHRRPGSVTPMLAVLRATTSSWLREDLAEAIARQGEEGLRALGELLQQDDGGTGLRQGILAGLGPVDDPAARRLLVDAAAEGSARDRTAALRQLRKLRDDPALDELRIAAALEHDWYLAAEALGQLARQDHPRTMDLAVQMHRRTKDTAPSDVQTELLRGLLAAPAAEEHFQALLQRAAAAEDALGAELEPRWRQALQQPAAQPALLAAARRGKPAERALTARLLGWLGGEPAGAALAALLGDKELDTAAAAATALGGLGGAGAAKALQAQLTAGDARAGHAMVALHGLRRDEPGWSEELQKAARHRDADARATALRLLAEVDAKNGVAVALEALPHKAWNVRLAAIQLLQQARDARALPPLIARVDQEDGRLRSDLLDALFELSGQRLTTGALWQRWWKEHGAGFTVPAARPPAAPAASRDGAATTVSYFSLPVLSDRVAFVLDTSGSMKEPMGTGGLTRFEEAVRQLGLVLEKLPPKTRFNVVTFGGRAQAIFDRLQPLDARSRGTALTALQAITPGTATNVHDGLRLAFRDPEVDTVFLLTDGRPSAGPVVDPVALAGTVRRWNLPRGVRLHTVAIGGRSDLLEVLARESGGAHTVSR